MIFNLSKIKHFRYMLTMSKVCIIIQNNLVSSDKGTNFLFFNETAKFFVLINTNKNWLDYLSLI